MFTLILRRIHFAKRAGSYAAATLTRSGDARGGTTRRQPHGEAHDRIQPQDGGPQPRGAVRQHRAARHRRRSRIPSADTDIDVVAPCNSLSEWRSIQVPAGTTDRLQIVPAPLGKSAHALRAEVRDGDVAVNSKRDPIAGGWRAEVVGPTETQSSTTVRYTWSTLLDPTYPANPKGSDGKPIWQVITQWHQGDADKGASPPIAFIIVGEEIRLHLNKPDGTEVGQYRVADLARGTWHDFQVDVRWALSGGTVKVWHNGQPVPGISPRQYRHSSPSRRTRPLQAPPS
ncbi:MAG: polysaccharide lyase [Pseudonocardiaceae bacterium]